MIKNFKGEDLKSTICSHPFKKIGFDYNIPMYDAAFVNLEQGTGIVHCAPSHGVDDFNLCLQNKIESKYTVDDSGFIQMKYLILENCTSLKLTYQ